MDMNAYQADALATAGQPDDPLTIGTLALCGEAGELANYVKKVVWHKHEFDVAKVVEELGDIMWYVAFLASHFNVPLSEVAKDNIAKLKMRYPEGFDPERSKARERK